MDILATRNYEIHHKFYFTLVTSLLITFITWYTLVTITPIYFYLNSLFFEYKFLYISFLSLTIGNNLYQVYAHIFTGTKFMGYKKIVPHGSRDKQSLSIFTISNIFDILGWLTIFVLHKKAHPFLALLASIHYGTGIISIFFNSTFQSYYIEEGKRKQDSDDFSYISWKIFRTCFVFTDALSRGISLFYF